VLFAEVLLRSAGSAVLLDEYTEWVILQDSMGDFASFSQRLRLAALFIFFFALVGMVR